MLFDSLTTLTLVWFIHTFLLIEADKQLLELLSRLKAALSMDEKGVVQQKQLIGLERFSFLEIDSYKDAIGDNNHLYVKQINKVLSKKKVVDIWKIVLMANLFLLTIEVILIMFINITSLPTVLLKVHIVVSLVLSAVFYFLCINKIQEVVFMKGVKN